MKSVFFYAKKQEGSDYLKIEAGFIYRWYINAIAIHSLSSFNGSLSLDLKMIARFPS